MTLALVLALFLLGCGSDGPAVPDVSHSPVAVKIKRFDKAFFAADVSNLSPASKKFAAEYGDFYTAYVQRIMRFGELGDSVSLFVMRQFLTHPDMLALQQDIEATYADMEPYETSLTEAFKLYHHYFPERAVPEVITMNSGFQYAVLSVDSTTLVLGLEFYLGRNYENYQYIGNLYKYQTREMDPENLTVHAVRGWIETEFELDDARHNMLETILHHGKNLYVLQRCMPTRHDSALIGYSTAQEQWCRENEFQLWGHMIKEKLLYSDNPEDIRTFTAPAPFTSGLDRQSPGKLGIWLGWQIVRNYMQKHPKTTLQELLEPTDAQEFLSDSGYKPNS